MSVSDPPDHSWYMDTGATNHLASDTGILNSISNMNKLNSVLVGNGTSIPVTHTGHSTLYSLHRPLHLHNVLITPEIIKNLISVRKFTTDNITSIEFDPFGFSVKDLLTKQLLLRSDSSGDLYPWSSQFTPRVALLSCSPALWHQRLGHPSPRVLQSLISNKFLSCNKNSSTVSCESCRLGKHVRLPFSISMSHVTEPFAIIHSDVWTSPITSVSGIKYYVLFLDHFSHFLWVYPLREKSDVFSKFLHFRAYVKNHFKCEIQSFQCDHGGEFDNRHFHSLFDQNGITFRFSCPRTSQQNRMSERMIRTINNVIRTLLFHAHLPPTYWVEALHMATHLLNLTPSTSIQNEIPFTKLFQKPPSYTHLRVFGCLCYPHIRTPHKLAPRTTPCIFLGYPSQHRGYRCLDLSSRKILISRHVVFDETSFPFRSMTPDSPPPYTFLDQFDPPSPISQYLFETPSPTEPTHSPVHVPEFSVNQPAHSPPTPPPPPPPPPPAHPMVTRLRHGITKPINRLNLHVSAESSIPKSYIHALRDPNWTIAMQDEFNALIANETWELVPRPPRANVVRSMWLFKKKFKADGSLDRYKARLVANGKSQRPEIDCDETFSPVVKPATIRSVLSIAVSRKWPIHQLDVKNAFLHGHLHETVYMHQPPGFRDPVHPDFVCHLKKSLYGLKQAPRAWFHRFAEYITRIGFTHSKTDSSLFIFSKGSATAYLLLYVDDIILTASSADLLRRTISMLSTEFAMSDLGDLSYFLGISATRDSTGLFLSQRKYALAILERANMSTCNSCRTPADSQTKLDSSGPPVADPTLYRSLAGGLQYLTFTRSDISFAVQQICLYMHDPREPHLHALKRILRYIRGTLDYGLQLHPSTTTSLIAYSDADWGGYPVSRRSTSGYCIYLGDNLISWSSKRQPTVSRSSAEAEYRGVANTVAETCWLRNLLRELHCPLSKATIVYCDNVSAVYLSTNPVQHHRTKHIEIDIHFVRDKVATGQIRVLHVPSTHQYADIFTKGLPYSLFTDFRTSLSVRLRSPPPTAGANISGKAKRSGGNCRQRVEEFEAGGLPGCEGLEYTNFEPGGIQPWRVGHTAKPA
ncbi:hypothetical protein OSB04_002903 [Centaurea solstitialis]|uniref:Integrase catalytic domain-containing protein n=1 Tax=Centaurea solstitialis TaxID=347529 RepID=A0AA38UBA6_9ASTR|nr:hypothetical protein OSB04_002903 [Centaurea solstitialis]